MSHLGRVTALAVLNALFLAPTVAAQEDEGSGAAAAVGVLMFVSILLLVAVVIFFAQRDTRGAPQTKSW